MATNNKDAKPFYDENGKFTAKIGSKVIVFFKGKKLIPPNNESYWIVNSPRSVMSECGQLYIINRCDYTWMPYIEPKSPAW